MIRLNRIVNPHRAGDKWEGADPTEAVGQFEPVYKCVFCRCDTDEEHMAIDMEMDKRNRLASQFGAGPTFGVWVVHHLSAQGDGWRVIWLRQTVAREPPGAPGLGGGPPGLRRQ